MTKILVTGAAGMIGFHLLKSLMTMQDCSLYALDKNISQEDNSTYNKERMDILKSISSNITFLEADLIDLVTVEKILHISPDVIIHLASVSGISESFNNPQFTLNNNQNSFIQLLELIRVNNLNTKLIYASSSSVYGKTIDSPIETNDKLLPTSSYGLSKLMNEQLAQLYYQNYGVVSVGLRFFTVYGEFNRKNMFMHYLLDSFQKQQNLTLYNNGLMKRDFTYVGDVVQSIMEIIQSPTFFQHEIFNIGGNGSFTLNHIVHLMQNEFSQIPNITKEPFVPVYDPLITYCDNSKLLSYYPHLNFTSLEQGIHNLVHWYKIFNKEFI